MAKKKRLAGRFLPSRVYARWKWTVRFGLSALPLILFLAGATTLYLSPPRFRSTTVFEYLGNRTPAEAAKLLKSRNVVDPTVRSLDLVKRWEIDLEALFPIIIQISKTSVDSETGMVRLQVTHSDKQAARDLAAGLVNSLEIYEKSLVTAGIRQRLELAERELLDAGDESEEKQQSLARLISLRGDVKEDPVSQLDVDAARAEWQHAQQMILDVRTRIANDNRELAAPGKWVAVHTPPVISSKPVTPGKSWTYHILTSAGIGLCFTLIVPYLLELAFPRFHRPQGKSRDVSSDEKPEPKLERLPV